MIIYDRILYRANAGMEAVHFAVIAVRADRVFKLIVAAHLSIGMQLCHCDHAMA